MNRRLALFVAIICLVAILAGCKSKPTSTTTTTQPATTRGPGPLPKNGFKTVINFPDPPAKPRAGEITKINFEVKNASDVVWWQRGGETNDRADNKFYIAAGSHWMDKEGNYTTEPEGHNGIPKDLRPAEETEMTLQITAPKTPGDWTLELDMVQEGVAWFREMGSSTTKVKVTVVK